MEKNMKKHNLILMLVIVTLLSACGQKVVVNSGEVGKEIGSDGLEERLRAPSAFRLEACPFSACPKLVRLQTAVAAETVTINKVFLPKSNIALDNVTFGIQFRIRPNEKSMNSAFDNISFSSI